MKTMILALAAATILSLSVAHAADHPRRVPHNTDPKDRVILVYSGPISADLRDCRFV